MGLARLASAFEAPLLERELLQLSSRRRTWVLRLAFGGLLFLGFAMMGGFSALLDARDVRGLGQGEEVLGCLFALELAGIYVFLPAFLAGSIVREREQGALELLTLTRLGPWAITLQKYLAGVVPMLALLLTSLPLMALAYAQGGIEPQAVVGAACWLLTFCLEIGALALMFSALCPRADVALLATYWLGAVAFGVAGGPQALFFDASALDFSFSVKHVVAHLGTAVFCLTLARVFLTLGLSPGAASLSRRGEGATPAPRHRAGAEAIPEDRPVLWLEGRRRQDRRVSRSLLWLAVLLAVAATLAAVAIRSLGPGLRTMYFSSAAAAALFILKTVLVLIAMAALVVVGIQAIALERKRGTLEALLVTPLGGAAIVEEKFLALGRRRKEFWVAFGTLFAMDLAVGLAAGGPLFGCILLLVFNALTIAILLPAFTWIGIAIGLRVRSDLRATFRGVAFVAVWVLFPAPTLGLGAHLVMLWGLQSVVASGDTAALLSVYLLMGNAIQWVVHFTVRDDCRRKAESLLARLATGQEAESFQNAAD